MARKRDEEERKSQVVGNGVGEEQRWMRRWHDG